MKLYEVTYEKDGHPRRKFAASDTEASKLCTALKKEEGVTGKPARESIDVPTDKVGLLGWLNSNATNAE